MQINFIKIPNLYFTHLFNSTCKNTKSYINFRAVHNQQVHLYYLIRRSALEAIFNVTYLLGSIGEQSGGTK